MMDKSVPDILQCVECNTTLSKQHARVHRGEIFHDSCFVEQQSEQSQSAPGHDNEVFCLEGSRVNSYVEDAVALAEHETGIRPNAEDILESALIEWVIKREAPQIQDRLAFGKKRDKGLSQFRDEWSIESDWMGLPEAIADATGAIPDHLRGQVADPPLEDARKPTRAALGIFFEVDYDDPPEIITLVDVEWGTELDIRYISGNNPVHSILILPCDRDGTLEYTVNSPHYGLKETDDTAEDIADTVVDELVGSLWKTGGYSIDANLDRLHVLYRTEEDSEFIDTSVFEEETTNAETK